MSEENWKSGLPEDMRDSPTLADVNSVESLAQQFIDNSAFLGNAIRVPGEDASAEDLSAFRGKLMDKRTGLMEIPNLEDSDAMQSVYDSLGRPKTAAEYAKPEIEGAVLDDAKFEALAETAYAAGISRRQFEALASKVMEGDAALASGAREKQEAGMTKLRDEWGTAYDAKVSKAAKLAELTEAPKGLVDAIKAGSVDAGTLQWLDKIGASLGGETSEMVKQAGGSDGGMTRSEAAARADEIFKTMMELPTGDPRYMDLMKKRVKYIEMAGKAA